MGALERSLSIRSELRVVEESEEGGREEEREEEEARARVRKVEWKSSSRVERRLRSGETRVDMSEEVVLVRPSRCERKRIGRENESARWKEERRERNATHIPHQLPIPHSSHLHELLLQFFLLLQPRPPPLFQLLLTHSLRPPFPSNLPLRKLVTDHLGEGLEEGGDGKVDHGGLGRVAVATGVVAVI